MNLKRSSPVDECVEELYKLSEWYKNAAKKMPTILMLTSAKIRCVGYLTTLATYVAEAKGDFKEKEDKYEFTFTKLNLAYLEGDYTIPKAKARAIIETDELKKEVISAYKYFTELDYFYERSSKMVESMMQDVATLKKEVEQSK